ncbi:MAG: chemotaxis protein CheD [Candidatus Eisenbacteria bacterium]
MNGEVRVGPAQAEVSVEPVGVIVATGIASTAVLAIFDPETRAGGVVHWIVPQAPKAQGRVEPSPALAADTAIPWLLGELEQRGAKRESMRACLVGCASLRGDSPLDLGRRNRDAAHRLLADSGIPIAAEAVGGASLRAFRLDLMNGRFEIEPREEKTA